MSAERVREARVFGPGFTLLDRARGVLAEAAAAESVDERFRLAHLAALRIAAGVLAERGRPAATRRRLISAWVLIESVAPEYGDWAGYFAAGAASRAAIEAGASHVVSAREADDQLRAAWAFLDVVEARFGLLATPLAS
jgi:SAV_6107-like HEPN